MRRTLIPRFLIVAVLVCSFRTVSTVCTGRATYRVTFTALWTSTSHPRQYPGSPHWSGLVGGSHNSMYTMWQPGNHSTAGMKTVAETGSQNTLLDEMSKQGSNILDTLALGSIGSGTGTTSEYLDVDGNHSLVSLVSMIAPSPDWFAGVHGLDLCNQTSWTQSRTVDLFPYDAGTDSGLTFTSADSATNPQEAIFRLTGTNPNNTQGSFYGNTTVPRMATLGFVRTSLTTPTSKTTTRKAEIANATTATAEITVPARQTVCKEKVIYRVTFTALWTSTSHPKDYPPDPHWSGLVGGSHNNMYTMWQPGDQSTTGMKNVAERGSQDTLLNEMSEQDSNILDTLALGGIGSGNGTTSGNLDVDGNHSLVSLVSMIAPSPDWFVGVHGLDLCNQSTWTQSRTVDLFPYDAGTDSGLTFTSADSATNPQEPIDRLTGTSPNNSFYGYSTVKRMATLRFMLTSPTMTTQGSGSEAVHTTTATAMCLMTVVLTWTALLI